MRLSLTIAVVIGVIGAILFVPVYLTEPTLNLNSLTAYYLAGFIFVEASIFLSREQNERKVSLDFLSD
jgi:hypothetical protein